ncbi:19559_t:CDS:2 [Gigaspora margarita]|uniref:19559_t:CDS:1 n=1 Tax=Gigaspora margarita TaxID=4874 RepID=A0ABN7VHX8_GIGMA|nr:19559_t:CDS:2 [Gigaspora margarita]
MSFFLSFEYKDSKIDTPLLRNEIYVSSVSKDISNKLPGQSLEDKKEQSPTFTESDYLSEYAENFISRIGENAWMSIFDSKILSEIKAKCCSKRNDIVAAIRHTLFSIFNKEHLDHINNNISSIKLAESKSSLKTKTAYEKLFKDQQILLKIGYMVVKQYKNKELSPLHYAFILQYMIFF